ncbi:MAG: hypothetical protein V1692_02900 [bacterium]
MENKNKKIILFSLLLVIGCGLFVNSASAAVGPLVDCEDKATGVKDAEGKEIIIKDVCTINDFGALMKRIADLILGISGSLALGFFVYGGFVWLTSSGNKERVAKGKNVLISATIGIIIVFISFMAVEFTIKSLTGSTEFNFFGGSTPWQELPAVD